MTAAADADKMASPLAAELDQLLLRAADLPPVARHAVAAVVESLLAEDAVSAVVGTAAHALLAALDAVGQPPSGSFLRAA